MGTVSNMSKDSPREYGTGSLFQRHEKSCPPLIDGPIIDGKVTKIRPEHACGGMWIGRLEAGWNAAGNRRRPQVSAKTEAECKRRLVKLRRTIEESGAPVEGVGSKTTVKQWAETWIEVRRSDLGAKTHAGYAGVLNKWVIPTIGKKALHALTPGDMRAVTKAELDGGNAPSSTVTSRRILIKCLRDAAVEGHKVPERIFKVQAPQAPKSDRDRIPPQDALDILNASLALPQAARWIVGFFEGMRRGEVLGLLWDHVDFDRGLIDVEWQLQTLPYLDKEAGTFSHPKKVRPRQLWKSYHLMPVKSRSGNRIIPIVGPARAALEYWREVAPESPHGLVFPRPDGRPANPQINTEEWVSLQDSAQVAYFDGKEGRRYDGHEIRHTTATLLLEAGVDPETVKAILGHSSIVTSRGYQHVSHELAREAMEKVSQRFAFKMPPRAAQIVASEPGA